MNKLVKKLAFIGVIIALTSGCHQNDGGTLSSKQQQKSDQIPHLKKQGKTAQLIVDEKPFLILGGELGNSSFTSVEYMEPIWQKLKTMNLNTVLAPVY